MAESKGRKKSLTEKKENGLLVLKIVVTTRDLLSQERVEYTEGNKSEKRMKIMMKIRAVKKKWPMLKEPKKSRGKSAEKQYTSRKRTLIQVVKKKL